MKKHDFNSKIIGDTPRIIVTNVEFFHKDTKIKLYYLRL